MTDKLVILESAGENRIAVNPSRVICVTQTKSDPPSCAIEFTFNDCWITVLGDLQTVVDKLNGLAPLPERMRF